MAAGLSLTEFLARNERERLKIPEYKAAVSDGLRAILAELGLKDHGRVEEELIDSPVQGFPTLTETVTFDSLDQRDAAVARLRPLFVALNPAHMTFGAGDHGPSGGSKGPRHSFNLSVHEWGEISQASELYRLMRDTVTALDAGLKAPKPGPA